MITLQLYMYNTVREPLTKNLPFIIAQAMPHQACKFSIFQRPSHKPMETIISKQSNSGSDFDNVVPFTDARKIAQKTEVKFDRRELEQILQVYSFMVAGGDWRDYAIDHMADKAVFSIFRRTSEMPLYRIEKDPKRAQKQGAYSVITAAGQVIKRGHDLKLVLKVFDKAIKLVQSD